MKKIILLIIPILLLCGCSIEETESSEQNENIQKYAPSYTYIYIDKETCVEYFVSDNAYNRGNVSPRYNPDGTLKLNKQCLKEKGE